MIDERYLWRGKRLDNGKWVSGYLCPPTYPGYMLNMLENSKIFDFVNFRHVQQGDTWYIAEETEWEYGYNGKVWVYNGIDSATIEPVAVKVIVQTEDGNGIPYEYEHYRCPNCENILHQHYRKSKEPMRYSQKYCHDCGQKLLWDLKGGESE